MTPSASAINCEIELIIKQHYKALQSEPDKKLEDIFLTGFVRASKNEEIIFTGGDWNSLFAGNEFYDSIAAGRILDERNGKDYILKLLGYRKPETSWEKIICFFTGELPYLNK